MQEGPSFLTKRSGVPTDYENGKDSAKVFEKERDIHLALLKEKVELLEGAKAKLYGTVRGASATSPVNRRSS